MNMSEVLDQSIVFIFTFLSTLFASVSGGGSGFIQFPLLILMGLPFATALGTHKVAIVFLGLGSLCKKKNQEYKLDKIIALIMLILGVPSVILGTLIVINVPSHIAEIFVGILTILMGIYTLFKKSFGQNTLASLSKLRLIIGCILIVLVGLFSGSLSSGAGLFATMIFTLVFGLELKRAIFHTMVFVSTLWNLIGAITVGAVTSIYWQWLPIMIIGSFLGAYMGTSLLIKLAPHKVRLMFSFVSMGSGSLLLYTVI